MIRWRVSGAPLEQISANQVIDRYTVLAKLGEGGMAVVYKVQHTQLGTLHAMKVLKLPHKSIRERLLQEGRVQAAMQHPNVVSVTDVIDVDGAPGLVMEFVPGASLDDLIVSHPLTLPQADELARGIISGVAAAHRQGLIHRDLKPANILLKITDDGLVPKITDFGLAKLLDAESGGRVATRSGMAMGTPSYMAPEQIESAKDADERADVFSLGAILYELVTGRRAYDDESMLKIFMQVTTGARVPAEQLVAELPERMKRAIDSALEVDRDKRVSTCDELLALWTGEAVKPGRRKRNSAWDTEVFQRMQEKGQGEALQADTGAENKTYMYADEDGGVGNSNTYAQDGQYGMTSVPSTDEVQARSIVSQPTIDSEVGTSPHSIPPHIAKRSLAVVAGLGTVFTLGILGVVVLIVGAVGGGVLVNSLGTGEPSPIATDGSTTADVPVANPEPNPAPDTGAAMVDGTAADAVAVEEPDAPDGSEVAGTPGEAPPVDEPSTAAHKPSTTPAPSVVKTPEPAPVTDPKPTTVIAVTRKPTPEPTPEPVVAPAPAPVVASTGSVTVSGDALEVHLVADGKRRSPGPEVPAGTYVIEAVFSDAGTVSAGRVEVIAGKAITLVCDGAFYTCGEL